VEPIYLFQIASQQSRWLAARQATIAENTANANTPSYKAKDIAPFAEVLDNTGFVPLTTTNPMHISLGPEDLAEPSFRDQGAWEVTLSGNSVSLEQEMIKASDVNSAYSLNTGIVKAFNNMLMASVKS
jgi:flagellar basal-body rod protein FlgB